MGNASGREAAVSGEDDRSMRSDGQPGFPPRPDHLSGDGVGNSPPDSPGRSRSPLMFGPQVPVAPLQRVVNAPSPFNQSWMGEHHGHSDAALEKGIPTLITWNHGGNDVFIEGSWDNWTTRKTLQRSGKDHTILLVLPSGVYNFRFLVDGVWRYIPDLPYIADEKGNITNLLDVHDYVPENLESVSEFESPPSPDSSYSRSFPVDEDFAKEPPAIPSQLHMGVLDTQNFEEDSMKPQHVILNHLFIEKGWASQSLVPLGLTHRFQSKYVTVVLYKPMRK